MAPARSIAVRSRRSFARRTRQSQPRVAVQDSASFGIGTPGMLAPDLILHGGKVITLDRSSRLAQAVSVRSGRVVAVGDGAALLKDAGPTTQLIDLAGRSVLPGFVDAHPHADREGLKARG